MKDTYNQISCLVTLSLFEILFFAALFLEQRLSSEVCFSAKCYINVPEHSEDSKTSFQDLWNGRLNCRS